MPSLISSGGSETVSSANRMPGRSAPQRNVAAIIEPRRTSNRVWDREFGSEWNVVAIDVLGFRPGSGSRVRFPFGLYDVLNRTADVSINMDGHDVASTAEDRTSPSSGVPPETANPDPVPGRRTDPGLYRYSTKGLESAGVGVHDPSQCCAGVRGDGFVRICCRTRPSPRKKIPVTSDSKADYP